VNVVKKAATKVVKAVVATTKSVVNATKQVVVAAAYYGAWLHGGGKARTIQASTYTWTVNSGTFAAAKSRGDGTRAYSGSGSINAGPIEGYLVVNGANAKNIQGTLTVSGDKWSFKGTASGISDKYNFEHQPNAGIARNAWAFAGRVFGAACSALRSCSPQDYDIYLPGTVDVSASGTF
jgi:hypothetical protein